MQHYRNTQKSVRKGCKALHLRGTFCTIPTRDSFFFFDIFQFREQYFCALLSKVRQRPKESKDFTEQFLRQIFYSVTESKEKVTCAVTENFKYFLFNFFSRIFFLGRCNNWNLPDSTDLCRATCKYRLQ